MQSIANFPCLPHGQSYAEQVKIHTAKEGTVMISQKDKAREGSRKSPPAGDAESLRLHRPEEQAPEVAAARAPRPEGEAGDADLRPHLYWSRVDEIQDRLTEGLFVPDGDLTFLKKTMEGR